MLRWRRPKTKQQLARIGEDHAARFLRARGYRILERNFRIRSGEVDIVAEHGETLVFVEVKARSSTDLADPQESVTPGKQRRIARAAAAYLAGRKGREPFTRFDVVEVFVTPAGQVQRVNVIEGAFEA